MFPVLQLRLSLQAKGAGLGDEIFRHSDVLPALFTVSGLLDSTKWRLGGRRVAYSQSATRS